MKPFRTRCEDGAVHFSNLKRFALSPAHYLASLTEPHKPKRAMSVGTIAHRLVLGSRPGHKIVRFPGPARRGKTWQDFEELHGDADIVTAPEYDAGEAVANAIVSHPVAGPMLRDCRKEVPLSWTDAGIQCATSGVDLLGVDWIGELKTSVTAHPERFQRLAVSMFYHSQLAFYASGAEIAKGIEIAEAVIIAAETTKPYPVTVFRLTPELLAEGRKHVYAWLERLRVCEDAQHWPEYAQTAVPFDRPAWMGSPLEEDDGPPEALADPFEALGGAA